MIEKSTNCLNGECITSCMFSVLRVLVRINPAQTSNPCHVSNTRNPKLKTLQELHTQLIHKLLRALNSKKSNCKALLQAPKQRNKLLNPSPKNPLNNLNPKPPENRTFLNTSTKALNPKPETPKPKTLNPKTLNPAHPSRGSARCRWAMRLLHVWDACSQLLWGDTSSNQYTGVSENEGYLILGSL